MNYKAQVSIPLITDAGEAKGNQQQWDSLALLQKNYPLQLSKIKYQARWANSLAH